MKQNKLERDFLRAYEEYSDDLFRFAFFKLHKNREEALDFVQNTFIKAWEYIADGKEVKNLRALLYKILRHLIIDYYRSPKSNPKDSIDALKEQGVQFKNQDHNNVITQVEYNEIISVLDKLTEDDKELVILRYVDGFGPKEISEMLGESQNVISVRLTRAKKHLKQLLKV